MLIFVVVFGTYFLEKYFSTAVRVGKHSHVSESHVRVSAINFLITKVGYKDRAPRLETFPCEISLSHCVEYEG
jgi:hypothetical protein